MLMTESLEPIAESVIERARRQGSVDPHEVREELEEAGVSCSLWKDVLALARPSLVYRDGRYHYQSPVSSRLLDEQARRARVELAVRDVIEEQKNTERQRDRRQRDRLAFIQSVRVIDEQGRSSTLLTRDISATGIRLIGTKHLLGQKLTIHIPAPGEGAETVFDVRILWSCSVADGMIENGGSLLSVRKK